MLELNPFRKNKVSLQDYDYQKDIQNRLLMAQFKEDDLKVLEEILFGHPKLTVSSLAQDLLMEESDVAAILTKLSHSGLFSIKDHQILLNKEMRKYFEAQLQQFEEDFIPGMEYLQSLLRKVPFDVLLTWYPIPRTSNNIFDSLVEKYLLTPQIFQRYLMELQFNHPKISSIVEDVYRASQFYIEASQLKKKHDLSDEEFHEIVLHLEFNFVCCLVYKKRGDEWIQVVAPFYEWQEYLKFLKESKPKALENEKSVLRWRDSDFAFIEDMTQLLKLVKESPLQLNLNKNEEWIPDKSSLKSLLKLIPSFNPSFQEDFALSYLGKLVQKLVFLGLCKIQDSTLKIHDSSDEWLRLSIENRALAVYKHTLTKLESLPFSTEVGTERSIREIEKSIHCVLHLGWVEFSDFLKSVTAIVSKDSKICLKKLGKSWKYTLPKYTEEEVHLIKTTIMDWLFEAGFVSLGYSEDKRYFRVTPFGQTIFS